MITTARPATSDRQALRAELKIQDQDGSLIAEQDVRLWGEPAIGSRAYFRTLPKDVLADMINDHFRRTGATGEGSLEPDDAQALEATHHYQVSLRRDDFLQLPGPGAFPVSPAFPSALDIASIVQQALAADTEVDAVCQAVTSVEEMSIELPKKLKILAIPPSVTIHDDFLSYRASYRLQGRTLKVRRILEDKSLGPTCPAAMAATARKFALKVQGNLKAQVLYR